MRDQFGLEQATADAQAMRHFDRALAKLLTLNNDPVAEADRALTFDPDFAMPQVIKGLANVLGMDTHDALAMFATHQADFLRGDSSELRDRVARRLPNLDAGSPLRGYYEGMHAFGLEEMGDYTAAISSGIRALESDRRNAWAIHAVAHVYEMTCRLDEGENWLKGRVDD